MWLKAQLLTNTAWAQVLLRMRWTAALDASVQWALANTGNSGTTVSTLPGNDPFEKVALVQELIHLGVAKISRP